VKALISIDTDVMLEEILQCQDEQQLLVHFAIPLSGQAYNELQQVEPWKTFLAALKNESEMRASNDRWVFIQSNGNCTSAVFYKFMFESLNVPPIFWSQVMLLQQLLRSICISFSTGMPCFRVVYSPTIIACQY
jgi:hypothetical protein